MCLRQLLLYSQFKSYFSQIVYNEQSIYDASSYSMDQDEEINV